MRAAAKAIGGYYPTPERVAAWLANYLTARAGAGELRAFDPCCGTGRALLDVTRGLSAGCITVVSQGQPCLNQDVKRGLGCPPLE